MYHHPTFERNLVFFRDGMGRVTEPAILVYLCFLPDLIPFVILESGLAVTAWCLWSKGHILGVFVDERLLVLGAHPLFVL